MAGVELATAYVSLVVEGSQIAPEVKRRFKDVGLAADRAGRDSGKKFSSGFGSGLGKTFAGIGIGTAIAGVVKQSVGLEAAFSKTMAQIGASTDGAAEHMDALNKLAMKLGAETSFSASDAAAAMLELGKAGINASDIMGGALSGTLTLAAAGGTDLGTAATIAANAMNTFGLKGKNMAQIAAALAGGANASSASVESLGQALQQVGPGATNAGLSLQETVATLSAFDAAGIKGSDAGTSLKTMLSRLVPQTDAAKNAMAKLGLKFTDAEGNFVPITNIAEQLKNKLTNLSEAQRTTALTTIFGSDASRAATVLMKQGAQGIEGYIKATKDQNAAEKLAKANMSGTAGAIERLKGSIETAELALGQALAPTVQNVANFLSNEAVPAITGFVQGMQDGTGAGGDLAGVLKDTLAVGKGLVGVLDDLPGPVKKFGAEGLIALVAFNKLSGLAGGAGVTGAIARTRQFRSEMSYSVTRMDSLKRATAGLGSALTNVAGAGGMLLLADGSRKAGTSMGVLETAAGGALSGAALGAFAGPPGAAIGAAIGGLAGGMFALAKGTDEASDTARVGAGPWQEYTAAIDGATAAITAQTKAAVYDRLQKAGVLEQAAALGISERIATQAALGNTAARKQLALAVNGQTDAEKRYQALQVEQRILQETGALQTSRLAQLEKNKAMAGTTAEADAIQRKIDAIAGRNVTATIRLSGAGTVIRELNSVDALLKSILAKSPIASSVPQQGIDGLLGGHRAQGGPVTAGTPYIVGEHRPELFVPHTSGRIVPHVPTAAASGMTGLRLFLVLDDGRTIGGYIDERADARIGAAGQISGMKERAY